MKTKVFSALLLLTAGALSALSCKKDDYPPYDIMVANAVVTVKPDEAGFYLQLDDSTVIYPTNVKESPFGDKEVRAFINYKVEQKYGKGEHPRTSLFAQDGYIYWFKDLLTKATVETKGTSEEDKTEYGNDAVEVVNAFPTVCEDGYLTLRFRAYWGLNGSVKHTVNLVTGTDPDDPYLVVFRHNDNGDTKDVLSDAYVAFNLSSLPDTNGEKVTLKLKYNTGNSDKIIKFDYKTRK